MPHMVRSLEVSQYTSAKGACELISNFAVWKLTRSATLSWIGSKAPPEREAAKSGEAHVDRPMAIGGCWSGYRMFRLAGHVCWVGCWSCVVKRKPLSTIGFAYFLSDWRAHVVKERI